MTGSLRALLDGAIDYAGMFPPAGLPLDEALAKYREHRRGPEVWMVGRFVCPSGQLKALDDVFCPRYDGGVTVIVPGADTGEGFSMTLDDTLATIRNSRSRTDIDMIECRWPTHLVKSPYTETFGVIVRTAVGQVTAMKLSPLVLFFEFPPSGTELSQYPWLKLVRTLGDYKENAGADDCSAGFKIRCGGTTGGEIPTAATVAAVICACRDAGVFWKATAGLHHRIRQVDKALGVPVHGFINLLTAAVMADVHRLDTGRVEAILEDDDPGHFQFANDAMTWGDLSATVPQIIAGRARSLRSFGSCSIDEPWQDLTGLGLL